MSASEHEDEEEDEDLGALEGNFGNDAPILYEKVNAMWPKGEVKPKLLDMMGNGADVGTKQVLIDRLVGAYFNAAKNAAQDGGEHQELDGDEHENVSEFQNVSSKEANSDFAQWMFESVKGMRKKLRHVQARTRTHLHTHTHTHTRTRTHARTQRTHTHTHARTHTHSRRQQAHARTHKHTLTRA